MKYQIDQSGKIEDTAKHTVIAYSNDSVAAVLLSAREKRKLQEMFRLIGKPKLYIYAGFSVLTYILIEPKLKLGDRAIFIIDKEYPGHDKTIQRLIQFFANRNIEIRWQLLGKSSKAHDIAFKVYKKKLKIGKIIRAETIWRLIKKRAGGRLNFGLSPKNWRSTPAS
jgi:hypothetical protein